MEQETDVQPLACCLGELKGERDRHLVLSRKLLAAISTRQELINGYRLGVSAAEMTLLHLAEWISLESQCCPFLDFRLESLRDRSIHWLEITGPEGAKEAMAAELWKMGEVAAG